MSDVKPLNGLYVIICQREVEEVDVFLHSLYVSRLGNDDDIVLNEELQGYLGCRLVVFLADGNECLVLIFPLKKT